MSATFALLVGIDAYAAPVPQLRGCVNDIEAIAEVLRGRVAAPADLAVRSLKDADATRENVIEGFRGHLARARKQDVALFYYSGHGSQAQAPPELWDVEPDHLVETLVLHDSRQEGRWDLADKELALLIAEVAAGGGHVLVVLDCCHSGNATRSAPGSDVRERRAPVDRRPRPVDTFLTGAAPTSVAAATDRAMQAVGEHSPYLVGEAGWTRTSAPHVLLAACRSSQTAKEVSDDGRSHGVFSSALQAALREAGGVLTYRDLHRWTVAGVRSRVAEQSPQLEVVSALELDRPFLGGMIKAAPPYYTLSHDPAKGWVLDAGAVHGVPASIGAESTQLAVFPLTNDGDRRVVAQALARARVTAVLADRSQVEVTGSLDAADTYRAMVTSIPLPAMAIRLLGDSAGLQALRASLGQMTSGLVVEATGSGEGDLLVEALATGYLLGRPGLPSRSLLRIEGDNAVQRAVSTLEHVARWMRLSRLRNPTTALASDAVRVELTTPTGQPADTTLRVSYTRAGIAERPPQFTVCLTNTTERTLWCSLVDLTETFGVFTDAFPAGAVELAPGRPQTRVFTGEVSDALLHRGVREVTDQLKVIVSTTEFDARSLEQPELDLAAPPPVGQVRSARQPTSTLDRLVQRVATRGFAAEPAALEEITDWCTTDVFVTVTRPEP